MTSTGNFVCDNSSLANFKNWAQAISNAFAAFGWTQTADTGQVNWASIASVPSSTYVYEIWKAADSLASSMPIYIKIEYGFSATQVGVRVTVGTASNGSGTITGAVATGFSAQLITNNANFNTNQGATTFPCYFSGTNGGFRMLMWINGAATPFLFAIERSKDATGANTADYFTIVWCSSAIRQQTITSALTVTTFETQVIGCTGSANNGTGAFGGTVAAFPIFPLIGKLGNPMLSVMAVIASDVADAATVTVASLYGSTHTYIACKTGGVFQRFAQLFNGVSNAVLMRYE